MARSHAHTSTSTGRPIQVRKSPDVASKGIQSGDSRKRSHMDKDTNDEDLIISNSLNSNRAIDDLPTQMYDVGYDRFSSLTNNAGNINATKDPVEETQNGNVKSRRISLLNRLRQLVYLMNYQ